MNLIQTHRNDIEITRESSTTDQSQMKISLTATQQVALYRLQEADNKFKILQIKDLEKGGQNYHKLKFRSCAGTLLEVTLSSNFYLGYLIFQIYTLARERETASKSAAICRLCYLETFLFSDFQKYFYVH